MTKKYMLALMALALVFSGCQKDDLPDNDQNGQYKEVVFSGSSGSDQTRTELGNTNQANIPIHWSDNDELGVLAASAGTTASNARASIMSGAGTQSGKFTSLAVEMAPTGNIFNIYYPYCKGALSGGNPTADSPIRYNENAGDPFLEIFLPENQKQKRAGKYDQHGTYGYSVAVSNPTAEGGEVNFTMRQLMSYLELSLWSTDAGLEDYVIESIEFESVDASKAVTGGLKSSFGGVSEIISHPQNSPKVQLSVGTPTKVIRDAVNMQRFLITTLPADLTGTDIKITVNLKEAVELSPRTKVYTKTFQGEKFEAGLMKKMNDDFSKWSVITTVSQGTQTLVQNIAALQAAADEWAAIPGNTPSSGYNGKYNDWLVPMFLRKLGGYTGTTWDATGGAMKDAFVTYVYDNYRAVYDYFNSSAGRNITGMDPDSYAQWSFATRTIDVPHMGATMTALLYSSAGTLVDLAGWAGDLVTLEIKIIKTYDTTGGTGNEANYKALLKQYLARPGTTYDMDDLMGDIDAINITKLVFDGMRIADAMSYYYSNPAGYPKRFTSFVAGFASETAFYNTVKSYTKPTLANFLVTYLYSQNGLASASSAITANQGEGIARGYVEYILELAAKE